MKRKSDFELEKMAVHIVDMWLARVGARNINRLSLIVRRKVQKIMKKSKE